MIASFTAWRSNRGSGQHSYRKSFGTGFLLFVALFLMTTSGLFAQGLGRISGTVTDTTGAVVPGAALASRRSEPEQRLR